MKHAQLVMLRSACWPWLLIAIGCSSDDSNMHSTDASIDASTGRDAGGSSKGAPSELFGYFDVDLIGMAAATAMKPAVDARTAVIGQTKDGPVPAPKAWAVDAEEGDCQLLVPDQPFCDPKCSGTAKCIEDAVCLAQPEPQSVGTVRVVGLGPELDMEALVPGIYQPPAGTVLPYPPCDEGDPIRLEAEGGDNDPFELTAQCIVPMDFPGPVAIEPKQPLRVLWTTPSMPKLGRIHLRFDISHHGGARGLIECDAPDTGSLTISAALVDGLLGLGVSGYPSIVLERSVTSTGSTPESEHVTLTVASRRENPVSIPGLTSCTTDEECPDGQTCQFDFRCQ